MSQENIEVVRRIYEEGIFDRHPERLLDFSTRDIGFVNPPEAIEPGIRRGRVAVVQALRRAHDFFHSPRYELHELFDCGDTVMAALSFYARPRGSETEIVQKEAHTWTLRDGRISRIEWGRDLTAALQAAGLSE